MLMPADKTISVMGRRFDSTRPALFSVADGLSLEQIVVEAVQRMRKDGQYSRAQVRSLLRYCRCRVDGIEVRRSQWAETYPHAGARIEVLRGVRGGGGGGGGGKNPLAAVATIAVVISAVWLGPTIGGMMGAAWNSAVVSTSLPLMTNAVAYSLGTGLILGGGLMLSGSLFQQAMPSLASGSSTYDSGKDSPTYSISGARNAANPYGYIPMVLGRHRHTPPLGAKSWTVWEGSDQYFNMLVVWGHPDITVSDFRIGDTSLDEFSGVEHAFHQSTTGDDLTLFAKSYNEQSVGVALKKSEGWQTRTVGEAEALSLDILFERGLTTLNSKNGARTNRTVQVEVQYKQVDAEEWVDSGYGVFSITKAQTKAYVRNVRIDNIERAVYEVRMRRITADSTSQYILDETKWSVMRAITNESAFNTPIPICVSELRIKANDQISGYVDDFNALCASRLPIWNGESWDEEIADTSNPAAHMRYLLTSRHGLVEPYTTARLDDTALSALYVWAEAQGHEFNFVCDSEKRVWERLTQTLSAARASVTTDVDGLWGAAIDSPDKTIKQLFTPRNSWGFRVQRSFMELPHAMRVSFVNEENDYAQEEAFVYADGYDESSAVNIVAWDYPGITNWAALWEMGRRHIAKMLHRQLAITLSTDWEWLAVHRGDLVGVASDVLMNTFGTARIMRLLYDVDGEEVLVGREEDIPLDEFDAPLVPIGVQLDDTVVFSDPSPARYGIAIRDAQSRLTTYEITPEYGQERDVLRFAYPLTSAQAPALRTLCSVSILGEEYDEYVVASIVPGENMTAELTLMPYAMDAIEASVSGTIPEYSGRSRLDVTRGVSLPRPTITLVRSDEGMLIRSAGGWSIVRVAAWWSIPGSSGYESGTSVQIMATDVLTEEVFTSSESDISEYVSLQGPVEGNEYDVRVRLISPIGKASPWSDSVRHTVIGRTSNPPDIESISATPTETGLLVEWSPAEVIDLATYSLRMGTSGDDWDNSTPVWSGKATSTILPMLAAGNYVFYVRAVDEIGLESVIPASVNVSIAAPVAPIASARIDVAEVVVEWTAPASDWPIAEYEVLKDSVSLGRYKTTSHRVQGVTSGAHTFSVRAYDQAGNVGAAGSVDVNVSAPGAVLISPQVIDNNVLLYWTKPTAGTFPVGHYEVRSGETLETSMLLGAVDAEFVTRFESVAGSYTYWVAAVDTSGNTGAWASISATVNQPPDYVLLYDFDSPFGGTLTNMVLDGGALVGPVVDETWSEHFTRVAEDDMQGIADSGYALYLMPNAVIGTYVEEIDYGTVLPGSKIYVTPTIQTIAGSPDISCLIEVKESVGDDWTTVAAAFEGYATAFRYARITMSFESDGHAAVRVTDLNIRYDIKQKSESGRVQCLASDSGGTPVLFTGSYVDVTSIIVSPKAGGSARNGTYAFEDVPNPTGFTVYLYDATGTRVDGEASWSMKGV